MLLVMRMGGPVFEACCWDMIPMVPSLEKLPALVAKSWMIMESTRMSPTLVMPN